MSDIFGCLADEFNNGEDGLLGSNGFYSGSYTSSSSSGSSSSSSSVPPFLKRSRVYYQPRKEGKLVGLDNQGATCYLNSLLQSLYLTPEFRQLLYDLTDDEIGFEHYLAHEAAEAESKAAFELMSDSEKASWKESQKAQAEPSDEAIDELVNMGMDRMNVIKTLKKYPNPSQKESALDYLFTHDFTLDPPEPVVAPKPPRKYKRIPIEFRKFFAHLQLGDQAIIGTEGITKSFGWDAAGGQAGVQHDIQELFLRLLEALSGSLSGLQAEKTMNQLYRGSMSTRTTCSVCGTISERSEHVYTFHAHVKGLKNLTHSLSEMIRPEKLDGNNMYHCSTCKKKVVAWRQDTIQTLPPMLTLALNRHEYNKKTWQRMKVNDRLPFPLRLDMRPYQDERARKSKSELEEMFATPPTSDASSSASSNDDELATALANSLKTPEQLAAEVEIEGQKQRNGKKGKNGQQQQQQPKKGKKGNDEDLYEGPAQLEPSFWDEASDMVYDLFSVVVHSGGAHGGHYYAYIQDVVGRENYFRSHPQAELDYETFLQTPSGANTWSLDGNHSKHPSFWYECNDTNVTPISFEHLPTQYGGKRTCAYILMYRLRRLSQESPCAQGEGPQPSEKVQEELALFNSSLAEERMIYEQLTNQIEIELHLPNEFDIYDGQLVPKGYDPIAAQAEDAAESARQEANRQADLQTDVFDAFVSMGVDMSETEEEKKAAVDKSKDKEAQTNTTSNAAEPSSSSSTSIAPIPVVSDPVPQPRRMIGDLRWTVPELHSKILTYLGSDLTSYGLDLTTPSSSSSPDDVGIKLTLNQLTLKSKPPHQVEGFLEMEDPLDGQMAQVDEKTSGNGGNGATAGKKKSKKPNPKTLEQLGFRNGQSLLVWNGKTINGKPYETGTKKDQVLSLKVVYFAPPSSDDVTTPPGVVEPSSSAVPSLEFFLTVSPTTTLLQLLSLLAERIGVSSTSQILLTTFHPRTKVMKSLHTLNEEDLPKPLKVLGFVQQMMIGVEKKLKKVQQQQAEKVNTDPATVAGGNRSTPLQSYFTTLSESVHLIVSDTLKMDGGASSSPSKDTIQFEIDALKRWTIRELKDVIYQKYLLPFHPNLDLKSFRLRTMIGLTKVGPLLNEGRTLKESERIEDDMHLRIEEGPVPNEETELDLLITILTNVQLNPTTTTTNTESTTTASVERVGLAKVIDRVPFIATKSYTIKELKQALLNHFGLSHRNESAYALYRGHATYDEAGKAFTNEFLTLNQISIQSSDWLWLEEGEIPTTGKVQLEIALVLQNGEKDANVTNVTASEPVSTEASSSSSSASSSPPSTSTHSIDQRLSLSEWRQLQQPIPPYTPLPAASPSSTPPPSDSTSLPSTISQVFLTPPQSYSLTPIFHLDFSSQDTLLELKQVLHAYPTGPLRSASSPNHLRIRMVNRGDTIGKILLGEDRTLKKLQISSDKKLAVTILEDPEFGLSIHTITLRVCMGVPSSLESAGVRVGPQRLEEVMFDGGEFPLHATLQELLSTKTGIVKKDLAILKWIGIGQPDKQTGKEKEKDGKKVESSPPSNGSDGPSIAAVTSPTPIAQGWIVLYPDGPDPTDANQVAKAANDKQSGKQTKQTQQQQKKKGGKQQQQQQQQQGGASSASTPAAPPSWFLKSGLYGLHDEDVLMVVSLSDFGCASLEELSHLTRAWCLRVAPPGYELVEKDRAEEIERRAAQERAKKAAPKRKEVELKIEY